MATIGAAGYEKRNLHKTIYIIIHDNIPSEVFAKYGLEYG
jgi:hypothetical protein